MTTAAGQRPSAGLGSPSILTALATAPWTKLRGLGARATRLPLQLMAAARHARATLRGHSPRHIAHDVFV